MDQSPSSVSEAQCWYEARIKALKSPRSSTAAASAEEEEMFRQSSPKSEQRPRTAGRMISELQRKG